MECTQQINESVLADCLQQRYWYDVCKGECVFEDVHKLSTDPGFEAKIYGKIFPILVIFVVVANILVALVLSKRHMVTPTNVVLKYMAIADLFVGLTPLPWTMFYFTFRNIENARMELWWCYVQKYSMDAFPPIFHNIAMWLTVLLAGQRFISISYPMYSRSLCNVANVRICTFVIGAISLVCGLPKSFDYNINLYDGWVITYENQTEPHHLRTCSVTSTAIVRYLGENLFFSTYYWTRALFFVAIPCTLLIGLNAGLIRGIRKAQRRKERLLREKRSRDAQRQTDSNSTSLMLVVIVTIFTAVNLPQAIFMVIMCMEQTFYFSVLNMEHATVFLASNNMAVMATYPINFAIYCFMSSSFRQTFRAMFCSQCLRGEQDSAAFAERKLENSAVPLVKFMPEDHTLNTCDENSIYRRDRRNDSVFL
ncbi:sprr-2 [Pristionchus pacificus]|uniref:Sprr-2 n=1 Tax=Pristionchus pacificus TaxID=54126 RepID=A0A2A6D1J0_PRIPA|nr:sprr-2 [Pristionchus pacificus]|eukprot:PDM84250.1 sprr-2 [Pristionchus pacificus]